MAQPVTKPVPKPEDTRVRGMVLTIYDFSESVTVLPNWLQYYAYGAETCPTTGRPHHQAFAYAKVPQRFVRWKKQFPTAHLEAMRGSFLQNEKYCSKQGSLIELGVRPMDNGHRRDLQQFCDRLIDGEKLKEVALDMPTTFCQYHNGLRSLQAYVSTPYEHDSVRGYWYWGPPGTGKSHYARHHFTGLYIKAQNKWFDGYNGETTILLDDFDCKLLGHYLKIWMDKWSCSGEVKGGTVHLQHHHFVVTSNYSIRDMFYPDENLIGAIERRCQIVHMDVPFEASTI